MIYISHKPTFHWLLFEPTSFRLNVEAPLGQYGCRPLDYHTAVLCLLHPNLWILFPPRTNICEHKCLFCVWMLDVIDIEYIEKPKNIYISAIFKSHKQYYSMITFIYYYFLIRNRNSRGMYYSLIGTFYHPPYAKVRTEDCIAIHYAAFKATNYLNTFLCYCHLSLSSPTVYRNQAT